MAIKYSTSLRNAIGDAITAHIDDAALLRIYDGTRPANVGTAVSTQTLLAELTFGTPFAGAASSGAVTANAITEDSSADASGTASWFRIFKADGTTAEADGDVGTSGADLNLVDTGITATEPVEVTSFVGTVGGA